MLFWNLVNSPFCPPALITQGSPHLLVTSSLPSSRGLLGRDLMSPGTYVGGWVCCLKLLCLLDPSCLAKICWLLWNRPSGVLGGQGAPSWWELADRVKDGRWLPLLRCSQASCQLPLPGL